MNKKRRKNNIKNYIYTILLIGGSILIMLYIFSWYNVKKEEKYMKSYLLSTKTIESKVDDLETLKAAISESPLSYFIYISYTGSEDIYNLERSLKRTIDKYKINDIFYYVDLTKECNNKEASYVKDINEMFKVDIENIPLIIYVNEGKVKQVISSRKDSLFKIEDFQSLLDKNEFETIK